ncbi:MAG: antitoxin VapB family protein [Candidatus Thermoplasmatota archaeon]
MTRQVALSEPAYAALKQAKQELESFSDVVERLLRNERRRGDPARFAKFPHRFTLSARDHAQEVEQGRQEDRPDPWQPNAPRRRSGR